MAGRSNTKPRMGCRAWVWLAACCLGGAVAPEAAGEAAVTDDAVMAAFIYNFGKFAEWPEGTAGERSGRFEICVTGVREDLRKALAALQGKSVQGREVAVRPLALPFTLEKSLDNSYRAVYRCGWTHRTRSSER